MKGKIAKSLERAVIFILLFATAFSWALVIREKTIAQPELQDVSWALDNRRVLLSDEINIMVAGKWDMGKTIREGDTVLWVKADVNRLNAGDIVLWKSRENALAASRIIARENGFFSLKGDSTESSAHLVGPDDIAGVVVGVFYRR